MGREKIVLAGGSGFLGKVLAKHFLAKGWDVAVLTRRVSGRTDGAREALWDGRSVREWQSELDGARAVVNLTGKSVNCRYKARNRREIVESRVESVRAVDAAIEKCVRKPEVLVQAATAAIYGDAGETICEEGAVMAEGFSPSVAKAWEAAFNEGKNCRRVILRIGFVLGKNGGALETLGKLTRYGLGGRVGSGRQWMSWIHELDFARVVEWVIEGSPTVAGMYLCVGPRPVRNEEFMRELRRVLRRPWSPPAPGWAVRVGCVLMGTEAELALKGRRCVPARLIAEGFGFRFLELNEALAEIYA